MRFLIWGFLLFNITLGLCYICMFWFLQHFISHFYPFPTFSMQLCHFILLPIQSCYFFCTLASLVFHYSSFWCSTATIYLQCWLSLLSHHSNSSVYLHNYGHDILLWISSNFQYSQLLYLSSITIVLWDFHLLYWFAMMLLQGFNLINMVLNLHIWLYFFSSSIFFYFWWSY